jgi:hypothetical protein
MKDLELSKKIWEIVDEIKKDSEKGYEYFIQSHKNIPDESHDVFSIELTKMCFTNLSESGYTNPTSIALNKVILYLSNAKQKINPIVKIKFNETDNITIKSFVKYFSLLRIEGKLTNTINELSEIIESITGFENDTIYRYLSEHKTHLEKTEMLLPKNYEEKPKQKKSRPSS